MGFGDINRLLDESHPFLFVFLEPKPWVLVVSMSTFYLFIGSQLQFQGPCEFLTLYNYYIRRYVNYKTLGLGNSLPLSVCL